MKLAPRTLKLPAITSLSLVCLFLGAACGEEAPLPTGGAGTTSTAGAAGSTGTSGSATGGSDTGTSGSTGVGGGASGSATGGSVQGGSSTGESGSSTGGTATAGSATGGSTAGGMSGGTGGSSGGSGGGSTGGGGAGGGGGDLKETVAGPLNGAMYLGACGNNSNQTVCQTGGGMACPAKNPQDPAVGGKLTTDKTITLGGDPSKVYTITLHVQGEVEAKGYNNGMDQNNSAAHPKMDGFYVGGTPQTGDDYNVYMARVSSPKQDYFLNSIKPPGVTDHTTYLIDYTAKIKANGGATIRMTAADTNCSMIKNCGPTPNGTTLCAQPLVMQNVDPVAVAKNPTFNFTQAYNGQWIVLVVTDVTQD